MSARHGNGFTVGFSEREVMAWGGLALMKQMLDRIHFRDAFPRFGVPEASSNRGYAASQLVEQFIVSIWCGACRFAHTEMVRLDSVLCRLFGWSCAAEFKAIMRFFGRFDILTNERVQGNMYRWLFGNLPHMKHVTLDLDSAVVTRNGQQEGACRGYNSARYGRVNHHPLLAFIADCDENPCSAHSFHSARDGPGCQRCMEGRRLSKITSYCLSHERSGLGSAACGPMPQTCHEI